MQSNHHFQLHSTARLTRPQSAHATQPFRLEILEKLLVVLSVPADPEPQRDLVEQGRTRHRPKFRHRYLRVRSLRTIQIAGRE